MAIKRAREHLTPEQQKEAYKRHVVEWRAQKDEKHCIEIRGIDKYKLAMIFGNANGQPEHVCKEIAVWLRQFGDLIESGNSEALGKRLTEMFHEANCLPIEVEGTASSALEMSWDDLLKHKVEGGDRAVYEREPKCFWKYVIEPADMTIIIKVIHPNISDTTFKLQSDMKGFMTMLDNTEGFNIISALNNAGNAMWDSMRYETTSGRSSFFKKLYKYEKLLHDIRDINRSGEEPASKQGLIEAAMASWIENKKI